jgi:hypothetical protein
MYLFLKLAKIPCFSYYRLCFFFYNIREQGQGRFYLEAWRVGEVNQIMYTHASKCKNDKNSLKTDVRTMPLDFSVYRTLRNKFLFFINKKNVHGGIYLFNLAQGCFDCLAYMSFLLLQWGTLFPLSTLYFIMHFTLYTEK